MKKSRPSNKHSVSASLRESEHEDSNPTLVPKLRFPEFRDSPSWNLETLSTFVAALDAGVSVNAGDRPATASEMGVLKTSCVTNGVFDLHENKVVLESEEIERVTENVRRDTIIISRMNTIALVGANAYIENDVANIFLPDRLWAAKPAPGVNMRFIAYILGSDRSRAALSELAAGSSGSMKNISKSAVLELLISAPERPEQQKIADCLSSLDELIAALGRKLDALKLQKKGLMQQLFPREGETQPRLRFPEFRNAPDWELRPLSFFVSSLNAGVSVLAGDRPASNNEIGVLKTSCVTGGVFESSENKVVSDPIQVGRVQEPVRSDTIIISRMNTFALVGANAYVDRNIENLYLPDRLWAAKGTENANMRFLSYVTGSERGRRELSAAARGSSGSMKNISKPDVLDLQIAAPKQAEQQRIASCLTSLDDLITAEAQKLEALRTHKKALMQQLFPSSECVG